MAIEIEPDGIRLRPPSLAPSMSDEDGLLVHEGEPTGDLMEAVEESRIRRDQEVGWALG